MTPLARVRVDGDPKLTIAHVEGEIDISNAGEVSSALEDALTEGAEAVVIDLSATSYLDSAGVRLLFLLAQRLRTRRQDLTLVVPQDAPIRTVLEMTGLTAFVPTEARLAAVRTNRSGYAPEMP